MEQVFRGFNRTIRVPIQIDPEAVTAEFQDGMGRLNPKQIVVAAMRNLLVPCFGVLKTGKPFDPAIVGC